MDWPKKANKFLAIFSEPFQLLTTTLLSILIPLSFLLLARLSCYSYLLGVHSDPANNPPFNSFIFSLILHTNPAILYFLVSIFSIATLLHGLTGKLTISTQISQSPNGFNKPHLFTAWILLCSLQVCVGLGIEGSISAGIDGYSFDKERSFISRVIFFLGLHETMIYWCRTVVKPVVDDTVFGVVREEKWFHRVAMAVSFGCLWWWRLRNEVESLVIVAESKIELAMDINMADFLGWWLYYVTVTIGMVKIVKGLIWVMMVLLCRTSVRNNYSCDPHENDDKV